MKIIYLYQQVLMRSLKSTGGMTRGRGLSEAQRAQWLLSMPVCTEINIAVQELTHTSFSTSDQHKESTHTRIAKDFKDSQIIMSYIIDRNPFSGDSSLRNIHNGVTAGEGVNADDAISVEQKIVEGMVGQDAFAYSFKRSNSFR